jgi:hypothetical protein
MKVYVKCMVYFLIISEISNKNYKLEKQIFENDVLASYLPNEIEDISYENLCLEHRKKIISSEIRRFYFIIQGY